MPRRSGRFSLTAFSSSPSWVLASWRLFFSCLTLVSTFSPAFNRCMSCCLIGSIPAPSALLSSGLHTYRTSQRNYLSRHILPAGVPLEFSEVVSAASSWALHSSSSWDSCVFFFVRHCIAHDPSNSYLHCFKSRGLLTYITFNSTHMYVFYILLRGSG